MPDSKRVAPDEAEGKQVHLRDSKEAMEGKMQEDLGISAPYNWSFIVAIWDDKQGKWTRYTTFDEFKEADKHFVKETNENIAGEEIAARLKANPDSSKNSRKIPKK